ncbi:MAG: tRNA (adenosine(37)-N6)-dimethylallyltransferase MiaA [Succinivibrio sp.]|nr:tRNA (adenosine(37)-N6)-dimethylallyltransferase MiaA [Succinivibrio sp.]
MVTSALVILGPTASGKTSLALALARRFQGEIISLDSALVYRRMDIGTAKPTAAELAAVPHHLINIIEPWESYSAAQFRSDCVRLVEEISARGHLPIICGGTMMYYKALVDGLSPLPTTVPAVRAQVSELARELGWPALHEQLRQFDQPMYEKLSVNDKQRISRAHEVYLMTGRPMSSFFAEKSAQCPFVRHEIVLLPEDDRAKLRVAIRERFMQMLKQGLIEEVRTLKSCPQLNLELPAIRCVGYRQVWEYLDGRFDYAQMVEQAVIATARLAKHQMTWLRGGLHEAGTGEHTRLSLRPDDSKLHESGADLIMRYWS